MHNYSISVSSPSRKYPLRDHLRTTLAQICVQEIADGSSGSPLGLSELVENWHNSQWQLVSQAYPLSHVEVMTEKLVRRVVIEERDGKLVATGVKLANGASILASKEIIVSAGAYRTP